MKKVAITGARGFVGSAITRALNEKGIEVISLGREELKDVEILKNKIDRIYGIINLAGAPIIGRWSEEYKKTLYSSRINTTNNLVKAISLCTNKPKVLISTSAVGIYDDKSIYDEDSTIYGDDFLANVCKDWEGSALKAKELGIRVVIFRFGVVLGKNGGMISKVLLPFSLGLGGNIGSGEQGFSWVHLDDLVSAEIRALEDENLEGIYNLTAPNPIDNKTFTKALGKVLHRPTIFPIPVFVLKIIFSEGAKVLSDRQKVLPTRLLKSGFEFKYKDIEKALEAIV